jgi:hypothetical protein
MGSSVVTTLINHTKEERVEGREDGKRGGGEWRMEDTEGSSGGVQYGMNSNKRSLRLTTMIEYMEMLIIHFIDYLCISNN